VRIVLDTNVLVSAVLKPESKPARILDLVLSGSATLLLDQRILYEYREVLLRPKFGLDAGLVDDFLAFLDRIAEFVPAAPLSRTIPDPDDLPFLEVAVTGQADYLVTGNVKDFGKPPQSLAILTPEEFLRRRS
jgi:putative PIN family toxin of toxin-antitoxin system